MHPTVFDDLILRAAGDGVDAPVDRRPSARFELEELMEAWSIERHRCIEFEFLLELSRSAISDLLLADRNRCSPDDLQDIQSLLRRINDQLDARSPDRA